ncbi:MAG: BLUF domain-containing protein [Planctomycetaceae bacterium]
MLYCLAYLSKARIEFDSEDLLALVRDAAEKNLEAGITGYLCLTEGRFIQYIEGAQADIERLVAKLHKDERHSIVATASSTTPSRRFPQWQMLKLDRSDLDRKADRLIDRFLVFLGRQARGDDPEYAAPLWQMMDAMADRLRPR